MGSVAIILSRNKTIKVTKYRDHVKRLFGKISLDMMPLSLKSNVKTLQQENILI
jgi:hypothetical protein